MLRTDFTAMSSVELELLPIEVLHFSNEEFRVVWCCDLDVNPMTFTQTCEHDLYPVQTDAD